MVKMVSHLLVMQWVHQRKIYDLIAKLEKRAPSALTTPGGKHAMAHRLTRYILLLLVGLSCVIYGLSAMAMPASRPQVQAF